MKVYGGQVLLPPLIVQQNSVQPSQQSAPGWQLRQVMTAIALPGRSR